MKQLLTYSLLLIAAVAFAQEKDKNLRKGNRLFNNENYADAEANYRISQSNAPTKAAAAYNLGNAIYRQKQLNEAKYAYGNALASAKTKSEKHRIYHNLGNIFMQEKNYQAAVEAYKNGLRNNPLDDETRYNYAVAKKLLKENPPKEQPPKQNKDDKDKEKQNQPPQQPKDQKNQEKDPQEKGKENERDKGGKGDNKDRDPANQDHGNGGGKAGQDKPQSGNPSRGEMERMLDAMDNEEKKVQDRVNSAKAKSNPNPKAKDW